MKINYIEVSIYKNSLLKSKLCQHFWQRFFSPMRWLSASGVMQRIGRGAQKFVDLCSGSSFQSIAPLLLLLFSTSRTVVAASSRTLRPSQTIEANEKPNDDSMITVAFAICIRTCKQVTTYDINHHHKYTKVRKFDHITFHKPLHLMFIEITHEKIWLFRA